MEKSNKEQEASTGGSKKSGSAGKGAQQHPDIQQLTQRMQQLEDVLQKVTEDNKAKEAEISQLRAEGKKMQTVLDKASQQLALDQPAKGPNVRPSKYKQVTLPVRDGEGKTVGQQVYTFRPSAIRVNKLYNPLAPANSHPFITIDEAVENAAAGDASVLLALIETVSTGNAPDFSRMGFYPDGEVQPVK